MKIDVQVVSKVEKNEARDNEEFRILFTWKNIFSMGVYNSYEKNPCNSHCTDTPSLARTIFYSCFTALTFTFASSSTAFFACLRSTPIRRIFSEVSPTTLTNTSAAAGYEPPFTVTFRLEMTLNTAPDCGTILHPFNWSPSASHLVLR